MQTETAELEPNDGVAEKENRALPILYSGSMMLADMEPNGSDARRVKSPEEDQRLKESLLLTGGCIVPIVLTSTDERWNNRKSPPYATIREGHRRWRIMKELGIPEAPVVVYDESGIADIMGEIANVQRLELDVVDKCHAIAEHFAAGYDKPFIMKALGIAGDKEWARTLKVGQLHEDVQQLVRERKIGLGVAFALTAFPADQQLKVLKTAGGAKNATDWTVRKMTQGAIPVEFARFPLEAYTGDYVEDLFDTRTTEGSEFSGRKFADPVQFWTLQDEWLVAESDRRKEKGELVVALDRRKKGGTNFQVAKHKDKRVPPATVIVANEGGAVEIVTKAEITDYEGNLFDPETGELLKTKKKGKDKGKETRVKAEAGKAKPVEPEDKAPFTKAGADILKMQVMAGAAHTVAEDLHAAMALVVSSLLEGTIPASRISGHAVSFVERFRLENVEAKPQTAAGKKHAKYIAVIGDTVEEAEEKKLAFQQILGMSPAAIKKLFCCLVAQQLDVDTMGGPIDEHLEVLTKYAGHEIADYIVADDIGEAITKAGAIQWMAALKMETKGAESLTRLNLVKAIATKFGSLEAAARKALPPLRGTAAD